MSENPQHPETPQPALPSPGRKRKPAPTGMPGQRLAPLTREIIEWMINRIVERRSRRDVFALYRRETLRRPSWKPLSDEMIDEYRAAAAAWIDESAKPENAQSAFANIIAGFRRVQTEAAELMRSSDHNIRVSAQAMFLRALREEADIRGLVVNKHAVIGLNANADFSKMSDADIKEWINASSRILSPGTVDPNGNGNGHSPVT